MKFSLNELPTFHQNGLQGWVYNTKDMLANASAVYFEVTGSHGKLKNIGSDRIYLVLDGEGEFVIDGDIIPVVKTDVIMIPKNTIYDYRTTTDVMKLFLVDSPAYDSSDDERLP